MMRCHSENSEETAVRTADPSLRSGQACRLLALLGVTFLLGAGTLSAQNVVTGTVIVDSAGTPVANAVVTVFRSHLQVTTDSLGRFSIEGLKQGFHDLTVKRVGFRPYVERLSVRPGRTTQVDIPLVRVPRSDSAVNGHGTFEENRTVGLGFFVSRAELATQETRKLSDVLGEIPQVTIINGLLGYAWITTKRETGPFTAIDKGDVRTGARRGCYATVYLDDNVVYRNKAPNTPTPLFNVNSISVDQIESIEYYEDHTETPMQYSALSWPECGVLVLHTRRAR